jgi:S-adenosylmethionine:tRNA ribosyltransferase-isomerase
MKISDFDYILPDENIAIYPPAVRGESRLLALNKVTGEVEHMMYKDIVDYLDEGDVLVLNNTKVIKARMDGVKSTGGKVEVIVLEEHGDNKHQTIMFRGKLKEGDRLRIKGEELGIRKVLGNGLAEVESKVDLYNLADEVGEVPIPPYMNREEEEIDRERYQTVFAKEKGSVAAPTASLNFTDELKERLEKKGVKICYLTLHVGLGTFMPIRSDDVEDHDMHSEYYQIPLDTIMAIQRAKQNGKKITALGTTVTRTLEFANKEILSSSTKSDLNGEANIFIYPGYEFKIVDRLITNFHAPRSTVLMLAAAFAGWENLKNAYKESIENGYKFLSYGDSMIIL